MAAQSPGDVREDRVPVIQLDGERRAWEDLLDGPEDLERRLFCILRLRLGRARFGVSASGVGSGYGSLPFELE